MDQSEVAFAKINLALHVRRRRADGYHDIETLFAFAQDGDVLQAREADALSLKIGGPFAAGLMDDDDNLVIRAAKQLQTHFGIAQGAAIYLDKRLPIASGIGGGSADAAAAARLLNRLWALNATEQELAGILAPLGADIPACVFSQTSFGSGTGTELVMVDDKSFTARHLLLVNPRRSVSTAAIFKSWDGEDRGALSHDNPWAATMSGRNDLQPAAAALCPAINDILKQLDRTKPALARMSGSGATCFALFPDAATLKAARTTLDPEWWTMATMLR